METLVDLSQEYRLRFSKQEAYREAVWRRLIAGHFQQYAPAGATVLDLGAGWGEFIRNVSAARKYAMDLNPDMPARVGKEVTPILQDCSKRWQVADESLDLVFTSNFFEHLPTKDALKSTLGEAYRCLRPGGRIVCLGPNIRFVQGAYWDFWDHFLALTERSMEEGLSLAGFKVERAIPRFLPYSMSQGFAPPTWLIGIYLKLPFLWRFFGKQFLVVAQKP